MESLILSNSLYFKLTGIETVTYLCLEGKKEKPSKFDIHCIAYSSFRNGKKNVLKHLRTEEV